MASINIDYSLLPVESKLSINANGGAYVNGNALVNLFSWLLPEVVSEFWRAKRRKLIWSR